jgi:hypothetical protein
MNLREAAQQALEALEGCVKALDALHAPGDSIYTRASDLADRAEIALRAALEQQEPEPVAHFGSAYVNENGVHITTVLGPVAIPQDAKLYTHPPRREWVSLTEEELNMIYSQPQTHKGQYARAIEAALKERNT